MRASGPSRSCGRALSRPGAHGGPPARVEGSAVAVRLPAPLPDQRCAAAEPGSPPPRAPPLSPLCPGALPCAQSTQSPPGCCSGTGWVLAAAV
eukprot:952364-Rhodomonas_salina.1